MSRSSGWSAWRSRNARPSASIRTSAIRSPPSDWTWPGRSAKPRTGRRMSGGGSSGPGDPCRARRGFPSVATRALSADLAADLATRTLGGVHVGVREARAQRPHERVEVARQDALRRRADDARGRDRPADAARRRRARRRAGRRCDRRGGAQERRDAAGHELLADVDVRLRDWRIDVGVAERVLDLLLAPADSRLEAAVAV